MKAPTLTIGELIKALNERDATIAALRAEVEEWKFRADHAEAYLQDATTSGGAVRAELEQLQEKVAEREQTTADAIEALVALGYSQREAREALNGVPAETTSVERRVKAALRGLGGKK